MDFVTAQLCQRTGFNQCAACNDGYTLTSESICQLGSENWASNTKVVRALATSAPKMDGFGKQLGKNEKCGFDLI